MDDDWQRATRRLWFGIVVRTLCASIVLSPCVAAVALLFSHFVPILSQSFFYITWALGLVVNLLAWLWATRQALLKAYPEGGFQLVPMATRSNLALHTDAASAGGL
jgi:hypothetical protein